MRQKGLYYDSSFLQAHEEKEILSWLETVHPIWENRFSKSNPPPAGESQRKLLRPVYWLGNWQFACLDYYRPPRGIQFRCVEAEPYPPVLKRLIHKIEKLAHQFFSPKEIPAGWTLNTCLINYYGSHIVNEKKNDVARVGEHKDFEPGPVASLSLGERAVFQFVKSRGRGHRSDVVVQQWLENGSLQLFGGERYKDQLFHRVQRVEKKAGFSFPIKVEDFVVRRINFTFRYVPKAHIQPLKNFPPHLRADLKDYVAELAKHSSFFAAQLKNI